MSRVACHSVVLGQRCPGCRGGAEGGAGSKVSGVQGGVGGCRWGAREGGCREVNVSIQLYYYRNNLCKRNVC